MEVKVFTNGCFDILHPGHVDLLARARALGTSLIVGINSDRSVGAIKGQGRPLQNENARAEVLRALRSVDEVLIFDEPTPARLIREVAPDVLVKGGDWQIDEIIGADFVLAKGGKVFSLPLKGEFSTTSIIEKIESSGEKNDAVRQENGGIIERSFRQHLELFRNLSENFRDKIQECADLIYQTIKTKNKILICGNGGSAADAQHIAAEFVGRYETERRAIPSIALHTDTSAMTAIANDYGYERVFARQIEAHAVEGDLLIALSTSGNSPSIIAAVMKARESGCRTIGLTGEKGKKLASLCDAAIMIPAERTARIQEAHITVAHIWCEIIDQKIAENA